MIRMSVMRMRESDGGRMVVVVMSAVVDRECRLKVLGTAIVASRTV